MNLQDVKAKVELQKNEYNNEPIYANSYDELRKSHFIEIYSVNFLRSS